MSADTRLGFPGPAPEDAADFRERQSPESLNVLITGGARDFGGAIARAMAKRYGTNVNLILGYHNKNPLVSRRSAETRGTLDATRTPHTFVQGDITTQEGINSLVAAVDMIGPGSAEEAKLDFAILSAAGPTADINVTTSHNLINELLPRMKEGGVIVYVHSYQGFFADRVGNMGLIPRNYGNVANTKNRAGKELWNRAPEIEAAGARLVIAVLPVMRDTANVKILEKTPDAVSTNAELTSLLGLPEHVTADEAAEYLLDALSKPSAKSRVEIMGTEDAPSVLGQLYGESEICVDVLHRETNTGYLIITPERVSHGKGDERIRPWRIGIGFAEFYISPDYTRDYFKDGVGTKTLSGAKQLELAAAALQSSFLDAPWKIVSIKDASLSMQIPPDSKVTAYLSSVTRSRDRMSGDVELVVDEKIVAIINGIEIAPREPSNREAISEAKLFQGALQTAVLLEADLDNQLGFIEEVTSLRFYREVHSGEVVKMRYFPSEGKDKSRIEGIVVLETADGQTVGAVTIKGKLASKTEMTRLPRT